MIINKYKLAKAIIAADFFSKFDSFLGTHREVKLLCDWASEFDTDDPQMAEALNSMVTDGMITQNELDALLAAAVIE